MSETPAKVPEFDSLEYTTEGGPDLGLGLHETETRLRIDLATRAAFLNRHQPTSPEGGEALGTFRTTLAPALITDLRATLGHADLAHIPTGTGGGPGTSVIQIRAKHGAKSVAASFSSRDMAILDKLEKLLSLLDDAVGATAQHPFQAIRIELQAQKGEGSTPAAFTIKIKNVGTETVAVPDLEMLAREPGQERDHGLGVRVAPNPPERPGFTAPPLVWSRVAMLPLAPNTPPQKPIILPPGGERTIQTAGLTGAPPLIAQAFFSFYAGPPIVDGHLMIRGHALSPGLDITH